MSNLPHETGRIDPTPFFLFGGLGVAFMGFALGAYVSIPGIALFLIGVWRWGR